MFQFRINYHLLYTRDKLFRAKNIENDECQLCGVRQTLEHLQKIKNLDLLWPEGSVRQKANKIRPGADANVSLNNMKEQKHLFVRATDTVCN